MLVSVTAVNYVRLLAQTPHYFGLGKVAIVLSQLVDGSKFRLRITCPHCTMPLLQQNGQKKKIQQTNKKINATAVLSKNCLVALQEFFFFGKRLLQREDAFETPSEKVSLELKDLTLLMSIMARIFFFLDSFE